jgi:hypothetical protein
MLPARAAVGGETSPPLFEEDRALAGIPATPFEPIRAVKRRPTLDR